MSEQYILSAKEVMSVIKTMELKAHSFYMGRPNANKEITASVLKDVNDAIRKEPMGEDKGIDIIRLYKIIEDSTKEYANRNNIKIDRDRLSEVIARPPSHEDRTRASVQRRLSQENPPSIDEAEPNTALSFTQKIDRSFSQLIKTTNDPEASSKATVYAAARYAADLVKNKFLKQVQDELRI